MEMIKNNEIATIEGSFLLVGTKDIELWTDGKPFAVSLETEKDFNSNGIDYKDFKDMKAGETRTDFDYEGIILIRIK